MADDYLKITFSDAENKSQALVQEAGTVQDLLSYMQQSIGGMLDAGFIGNFRQDLELRWQYLQDHLDVLSKEIDEIGRELRIASDRFRDIDAECAKLLGESSSILDYNAVASGQASGSVSWRQHADRKNYWRQSIATDEQSLRAVQNQLSGLNYWKNLLTGRLGYYQQLQSRLQSRLQASRESLALDTIDDIRGLRPEVWKTLSVQQRGNVLAQAHRAYAQAYGINSVDFVVKDINANNPGLRGQTNGSRILLDDDIVKSSNPSQALTTAIHESRHVFQYRVTANPGSYSYIPNNVVQAWRYNQTHYVGGSNGNYQAYYKQVIEVDARRAGETTSGYLYK